jgi:myo-inositol-1(or 4)-monophosphatase
MNVRSETVSAVAAVRRALQDVAARDEASNTITKGDADFATGTDLRSQEMIQAHLQRSHPDHRFIGEESRSGAVPDSGSYWLVDPLCGTRNFASAIPLYAINVALVEDQQVTLGIVGDGASGVISFAERGRGAWSDQDGRVGRMSASDRSNTIVLDPGRPGGPAAIKAARVISTAITRGGRELRVLGTTLDLAYLAAGRVAGVWHFSRIAPLHFAAGALLALEAGAVVSDEQEQPWSLTADGLVAAATPALHAELLALAVS